MRKVIASVFITLDGFMEGPNGELNWRASTEENKSNAYEEKDTDELVSSADAILLGRKAYQVLTDYWPSAPDDEFLAYKMNTIPKFVFSKTLDKVEWGKWNNATLLRGDLSQEISKMKQQPGKNMVIFGSGSLVSSLTRLGLIDEYRILVNPVILGGGKPLFRDLAKPVGLRLLRVQDFKNGVTALYYEPQRKGSRPLEATR